MVPVFSKTFPRRTFLGWSLVLFAGLAAGCGSSPESTSGSPAAKTTETTETKAIAAPLPSPGVDSAPGERDGSPNAPLRMVMMPAEAGAIDKTLARIKPILDEITRDTGLHFEVKFTDSYAGTLESLAARHADVAQLGGPFVYLKARERGVAELLAIGVREGESTYYSAVFVNNKTGIKTLKDLKGRSCAFGDVNSMSSFNYPIAMMFQAGVNPVKDMSAVYLTNSHAGVLAALAAGKVDAGCCSIGSFEAAVTQGRIDPEKFTMIAKSDAIPGTPLVMWPKLPAGVKAKLRQGFANLEKHPEILAKLRTDNGKTLDKYDTSLTDADYDKVAVFLRPLTDDFKAQMLAKAGKKPAS
ncbi:MAG: phosphate/phosphite/phosphonate ABC transporter substrate-binding protein [Capsulimonadales bacterium]|nr:phosphate/phosphite/phosphonate ABC transporter substrate-binding protein [Capsulimonadales bacterium]